MFISELPPAAAPRRPRAWEKGFKSEPLCRGLKRKLPETVAPPRIPSFAVFCFMLECSRKWWF